MDIFQSMTNYVLHTTLTNIMLRDITGINYTNNMTIVTTNYTTLKFNGFISFR